MSGLQNIGSDIASVYKLFQRVERDLDKLLSSNFPLLFI